MGKVYAAVAAVVGRRQGCKAGAWEYADNEIGRQIHKNKKRSEQDASWLCQGFFRGESMKKTFAPVKNTEARIVKNCSVCGSDNVSWESAFDFKCRIICKTCGNHTVWHLDNLEKAVEDWNKT